MSARELRRLLVARDEEIARLNDQIVQQARAHQCDIEEILRKVSTSDIVIYVLSTP